MGKLTDWGTCSMEKARSKAVLLAMLAAAPAPQHIDEPCRASALPAAEVSGAQERFPHAIQPFLYESAEQLWLFDWQKMPGAVQHSEGATRILFQHAPLIAIA